MCGISGHCSTNVGQTSLDVVLSGLSRLEYRGYDSAGIAVHTGDDIVTSKAVGKLVNLKAQLQSEPLPDAVCGIGHTRWATHGAPTTSNAHPHVSYDGVITLVHNGIIENADVFRSGLRSEGVVFSSETDTEVMVHLLAKEYAALDVADANARMIEAIRKCTARVEGTFTLLILNKDCPGHIFAARRSSPLVIGLGEGENFLGSDALAFAEYTQTALEIGQDEIVDVTANSVVVYNSDGEEVLPKKFSVDSIRGRADKDGWPTFMEKEIHEQPRAVRDTLACRTDKDGFLTLDELRIEQSILRTIDKIIVVACGTAAYAGMVARYAIEHWCRIPVEVELAHEFRYRDPVVNEKTLVVAISQSGETMDTIMAIRHAREQGAKVLAIVNAPGSTISRESDAVLLTHAGPEIAVASTKAFTAQITACYLLGLYLAQVRGNKYVDEIATYLDELSKIPDKMQEVLDNGEQIRQVARQMVSTSSVIFLGRHVSYPIALEGALKLKELAYIHAEGFAAGELKHGPIALIEAGQPVFVVVPTKRRPVLHQKVISNIQEVRARGAKTLVIAEQGDDFVNDYAEVIFRVPQTPTLFLPLVTVIPMQIFACEVASAKGLDVDQPRNLAKSVTVE